MATVAIPTDPCKALTTDLYGAPDVGFPDREQATRPERAAYRQAAQPEPLPEAAFSLTLKGTIGGHDALLTIRGATFDAFQANVAAVRGMMDPAPAHAPAALPQTYGARQAEKALGPVPAARPEGWCAVHGVQMPKQSNARGSWFSHKTAEGSWCKGK